MRFFVHKSSVDFMSWGDAQVAVYWRKYLRSWPDGVEFA